MTTEELLAIPADRAGANNHKRFMGILDDVENTVKRLYRDDSGQYPNPDLTELQAVVKKIADDNFDPSEKTRPLGSCDERTPLS